MKKEKVWNLVCVAALFLQVLAEGFVMFHVLRLNMLPDVYVAILGGLFVLLTLATAGVMFLRRKKPVSTVRRIVGIFLALLIMVGCGVVSYVVDQIHDTMAGIADSPENTTSRNVYVLQEDSAQSLEDARNYTFGYVLDYDTECTDKTLQMLEKELGKIVDAKGYDTVFAMVDALYSGEIKALILNDAYLTILEDWVGYEDFGEKTRVLYTAVLEDVEPDPVPETTQPEATGSARPDPKLPITERPFLIYLSGSDTRYKKLGSRTRSDVNILAAVNPVTKQVLLLNTPRDYYVENPAGGGAFDKLTHCGIYGTECSVEALENLYNTTVDGYAKINFAGFETLIDEIGGVTVGVTFTKGNNTLNGKEALIFARERYSLSQGDRDRGKNQMRILEAVIKKLTTSTALISSYSDILKNLKGMLKTDIPTEDIGALVKLQLQEMPQWEVLSFAVSGKTGKDKNYSMPGLKASVMYQDEKLVGQASDLLAKMLSGQILTEADLKID